ncbi:hypothetical protein [Bifidobacterium simiarum]|uniref:hypothetical protein n=1 Tax=Bifidobacterium simiarum TaxID=2045441 RepID=UPI0010557A0C|nr:hypothetical protein [Bifidobacterium simiarum]
MVTWIETTEDTRWQTKPAPETGVASINGVRLTGVGYQWEGRDCIERTHKAWPELKLMQTESECGMATTPGSTRNTSSTSSTTT